MQDRSGNDGAMTVERTQRILVQLWPEGDNRQPMQMFAVLDGARDKRIVPMLRGSGQDYRCLYSGQLSPRLAAAAPYLVTLPSRHLSFFAEELLELAWGQSWGIFVESAASLSDLRRHFRRFLRVQDESGKSMVFRWYDPRVLRVYLPTCHARELRQIFGPVRCYWLEGEDPDALLRYHLDGDALKQSMVDLGMASGGGEGLEIC